MKSCFSERHKSIHSKALMKQKVRTKVISSQHPGWELSPVSATVSALCVSEVRLQEHILVDPSHQAVDVWGHLLLAFYQRQHYIQSLLSVTRLVPPSFIYMQKKENTLESQTCKHFNSEIFFNVKEKQWSKSLSSCEQVCVWVCLHNQLLLIMQLLLLTLRHYIIWAFKGVCPQH